MKTDLDFLNRALELAEMGRGRTSPNPMVGAVVVKDGNIIGEGYHHRAGEPHAEVLAISEAGSGAAGAALFVTLEPCCSTGRTPPCTDLIIRSGIARVVIGSKDPNPEVDGKGVRVLEEAGIETRIAAEMTEKVALQNEVFFKFIRTKKSFVTAKMAMTIDGRIAAALGERTRLTGEEALGDVHSLRDRVDAVLVGIDTVICDDPLLTARGASAESRNPVRIIVDTRARLPLDSQIVKTAGEVKTFIATAPDANQAHLERLVDAGISVITVANEDGMLDLSDLINWTAELELTSLLLEGGARLFGSLARARLIDKYIFFIAPLMMGWEKSVDMISLEAPLNQKLRFDEVTAVGKDIKVIAYPYERG